MPPKGTPPGPADLAFAAISLALFAVALRLLRRDARRLGLAAGLGLLLILATTLTHGLEAGLARPIGGTDLTKAEYLDDAARIDDPLAFVRSFETVQPGLLGHSGTHPPGAVLFYYVLHRLLPDPAWIGLAMAVLAVLLSALAFGAFLGSPAGDGLAGRTLFLFLMVPAVQIYFAASLDAVIAPLVFGAALHTIAPGRRHLAASAVCLLLASTLSFTFVFVLPVLVAMQGKTRSGWIRLIVQLGVLLAFWSLVDGLLGYNYLRSFVIAAGAENPHGFRLLAAPGDYWMTRFEDVAEMLLFLGPVPIALGVLGMRRAGWSNALNRLALLAIGSMGLVFLTGAYWTGETARGALYLYPFLLLPASNALPDCETADRFGILAGLAFAQSLLMQLAANFYW